MGDRSLRFCFVRAGGMPARPLIIVSRSFLRAFRFRDGSFFSSLRESN